MAKSSYVKRRQEAETTQQAYDLQREKALGKSRAKRETVEEFLARGGEVKKYAYKKPPCWKKTFNGFSKYDKRKG